MSSDKSGDIISHLQKVTVSSRCTVSLPEVVRKSLAIKAGDELLLVVRGKHIEMIRIPDIDEMKGCMPNLTLEGIRDEDDRF
jgi:AbrB family looped-hinge helix DNA binding protein